ncbi:MAG: Flp pilus assembly complex ATPase component TadA, partial [Magnetococcales bacterium]|nr:Flp pilus assembly complex ATPase component TadA [Magnetococcales bacterium]
MERDQAIKFMLDALTGMKSKGGSDLFITANYPPAAKLDGKMTPLTKQPLAPADTSMLVRAIMNDRQVKEFDATRECNFAINPKGVGRFRVNAFVQQGHSGMVLRTITTDIPDFDKMNLPPILKDVVLSKTGLVLVVGGTGSGKSTTLAAMLGVRNQQTHGHIITIEDPIEYVHPHINCMITQREVGVDTAGWEEALKNTLRQAPDVILIGEVREQ